LEKKEDVRPENPKGGENSSSGSIAATTTVIDGKKRIDAE